MQWFKHMAGSHEDPDIAEAWVQHGDKAVVVFWVMLEVYAREWNRVDKDGYLKITTAFISRKLRCQWRTAKKILSFYAARGRFLVRVDGDRVAFKVPKFIEMAGSWDKRRARAAATAPGERQNTDRPGESDASGTIARLKTFADLPEEDRDRIKTLLDQLTARGYFGPQSKWKSPYQMVAAMLSRNCLPEAIIDGLRAVLDNSPETEQYAFTVAKKRTDQVNYAKSLQEHARAKRL